MTKSGLVAMWNKNHEIKGNDCLYPLIVRAGDVKKIGLSHMMGCFFVLGLGLLGGLLILSFEIAKNRKMFASIVKPKLSLKRKANNNNNNNKAESSHSRWAKLSRLYHKINKGELYEAWIESRNNRKAKANGTRPPLEAPRDISTTITSSSYRTNLERQQRMYYFQKQLEMNRLTYPYTHTFHR